jgi:hypothetical protein
MSFPGRSVSACTLALSLTPLVEEETRFTNTETVTERTQIRSWIPTGLETKNDCAGEDQQQITRPNQNQGAADLMLVCIREVSLSVLEQMLRGFTRSKCCCVLVWSGKLLLALDSIVILVSES